MARKRTDHGSAVEARIAALAARGGTAETIAKALRTDGVKGVSARTIGRRLRELRGKVRVGRTTTRARAPKVELEPPELPAPAGSPPTADPPLPSSPDAIPEGLSLDMLHRLRAKADGAAQHALAQQDLATFAAMGRLVTGLSEAIRKATPPEKPDPEDSPDMIAAATRARETLHKLVDQAVGHG